MASLIGRPGSLRMCFSEFQWISALGAGWGAGPLVFLGLEFVLVIYGVNNHHILKIGL